MYITITRKAAIIGSLVFVIYLLLSVALFFSTWTSSPFTHWIGTPGDVNEFMWGLYWVPYALVHDRNLLLSNYLMYPHGVNLMWNTLIIGPALVLAPITLIFGVIFSYNLLATLAIGISSFVAYIGIRRLNLSLWPAFVGGLLFGFSPYMVAQSLGHINLTLNWYPPLMLIFLDLFLIKKNKNRWLGILFGVLTAFQLITGEEILVTSILSGAIFLVILALVFPSKIILSIKTSWINFSLAILTATLLSAYPLYIQLFGPKVIRGTIQSSIASNYYVTDLANLVTPTQVNYVFPHWVKVESIRFTGNIAEWDGYLGVPLIIIFFLITILFWKKPVVRVASVFSITLLILSMGTQLHINGQIEKIPLPWSVIKNLPILKNILPNRLMNYVFLSIATMLAIGLEELIKHKSGKIVGSAIVAISLISVFPMYPYMSTKATIPFFFTSKDVKIIPKQSVVLLTPYTIPSLPALWQIKSRFRFKMPEGPVWTTYNHGKPIYGAEPSLLRSYLDKIETGQRSIPSITASSLAIMRKYIKQNSVRTVIVGPYASGISRIPSTNTNIFAHPSLNPFIQEQQAKELFTLILNRKPIFMKGVYIWKNTQTGVIS